MQVEIESSHFEVTDAIRDHVERHLGFALERHADEIGTVAVRLLDRTGRRGAPGKRCHIAVHVATLKSTVVVGDTAPDLREAVARAAELAGKAVDRMLAAGWT